MSSDPAMADGLNWYRYANNNPIMYRDPTGLSTWITNAVDNDGGQEVLDAAADHDTNVYEWAGEGDAPSHEELQNRTAQEREADMESRNWRVVGETRYDDTHISPDTKNVVGKVYLRQSIDRYIDNLYNEAKKETEASLAMNSLPGKKYDVKQNYPGHEGFSYHSFLYRGKYMTLRELGNVLAGRNARYHNIDFLRFQQLAGALHKGTGHALWHRLTGHIYGWHPRWGENDYQYLRSFWGYYEIYLYNFGGDLRNLPDWYVVRLWMD